MSRVVAAIKNKMPSSSTMEELIIVKCERVPKNNIFHASLILFYSYSEGESMATVDVVCKFQTDKAVHSMEAVEQCFLAKVI